MTGFIIGFAFRVPYCGRRSFCEKLLCFFRFEIIHDVTDGHEFLKILFVDFDSEFFLTGKYEVGKLEGVDAQVVDQLGRLGDIVRIQVHLFYQ